MRCQTCSSVVFAAAMAMSAACGDDGPTSTDAGNNRDAAVDGAGSPDGGDIDGSVPDGHPGMPDGGPITPDAIPSPDAPPQSAMWRDAAMIETLSGSARAPVAGMDSAGRAIVLWSNDLQDPEDETRSYGEIRASHFDPATGWGGPIALSPPPTSSVHVRGFGFDLAVNAAGEAMAIWYWIDGAEGVDVIARRFTPAGGWLPPTVLHDSDASNQASVRPHVAIASDGSAMAIWSQRVGLDSQLHARRFVPASGWHEDTLLHAVPGGDALGQDIAMDASGGAVAVWTVRAGGGTLYGSRFSTSTGWSVPLRLDEAATMQGVIDADFAQVAVDPTGNAVVVLDAQDESSSVWAVIGTADGSWQAATRLSETTMYANDIDVAADAAGNAIVVWKSWPNGDGPALPDVRARRFAPGAGWSAIETLETSGESTRAPRIAMTPDGIATVAWTQIGSGVWASRLVPGSGWGTAVKISSTTGGHHDEPAVAAGGTDSAVVAWPHEANPIDNHPTPFDLWANVYR